MTERQTYDKVAISALVATLRFLFDLRPKLEVIISGAVRNAETFETFRHACSTLHRYMAAVDIADMLVQCVAS